MITILKVFNKKLIKPGNKQGNKPGNKQGNKPGHKPTNKQTNKTSYCIKQICWIKKTQEIPLQAGTSAFQSSVLRQVISSNPDNL